jgi:hypothetical protein
MVVLTAIVLATLFRSRVGAVRQGLVSATYFHIYQGESEPQSSAKAARHFANLFEAPVLYYVVCLAAMITHFIGGAMQVLAWVYVAARVVHAYVHLGTNRLRHRMRAYFFSWGVLLAMCNRVLRHPPQNNVGLPDECRRVPRATIPIQSRRKRMRTDARWRRRGSSREASQLSIRQSCNVF